MMEEYGKFIFLDKEMEEKVSKMRDEELNIFCALIANSLRETRNKIEDEFWLKDQIKHTDN
jgi:hypothetical protein